MHFNLALIQYIAEHRNPLLTHFFLWCSFIGDVNGYILIITLVYVMWDKRLALRMAILVLFTSSLNHFLKIIIKNPRPFVKQGTYLKEWAIPQADARGLATEYSTPSGHAMASAAFYPYLFSSTKDRVIKVVSIVALLCIGLSRPYLGVHYVEDILLGWAIGLAVALAANKYLERMEQFWSRLHYKHQIAAVILCSLLVCAASVLLNELHVDNQQRAFASYAGFLSGVLVAYPLEVKFVNFNPKSSHWSLKGARYLVSVALIITALYLMGKGFGKLTHDTTLVGFGVEYIRYAVAGFVSMLAAPFLFTFIGLAEKHK
jgi:membrane-associated phospholipid phosphatase